MSPQRYFLCFLSTVMVAVQACDPPSGPRQEEPGKPAALLDSAWDMRNESPRRVLSLTRQVFETCEPCADSIRCRAWIRMTSAFHALQLPDSALAVWDSVQKHCTSAPSALLANALHNSATVLIQAGSYDAAQQQLEMARQIAASLEDTTQLAHIAQSMASIAHHMDAGKALKKYSLDALHFSQISGEKAAEARALGGLVAYYLQHTMPDSALFYSKRALEAQAGSHDPEAYTVSMLNMGAAYHELKNTDSAAHYYNLAMKNADATGNAVLRSQSRISLAYLYYDLGEYMQAFKLLDHATDIEDSTGRSTFAKQLAELQVRYESVQRKQELTELRAESQKARWRNYLLLVGVIVFACTTLLIFLLYRQRVKRLQKEREVMALQHVLFAQEEERQRIARDLHDGIGALLSTASMQISKVEEEIEKLRGMDLLKRTDQLIRTARQEVRRVSHHMMPGVLLELGLVEGIGDFLESLEGPFRVHFEYNNENKRYGNEVEVMVFRIVQELVQNSIKHSGAAGAELTFHEKDGALILTYCDQGQGFDPEEWENLGNLGLNSIRSRASFLQGRISTETRPGKGMFFKLHIPLHHG